MTSQANPATFWNRQAAKYAATPIKDMEGYERSLARTIELIRGMNAVAELGCGTGMTAVRLAGHVGRLDATDVSPAMVAIAEERRVAAGIDNARFATAPAEGSGLQAKAYDAVLAFNLLHLTLDRSVVLAEAWRLLRPGGILISKTPCIREMNVLIRIGISVMRAIGKVPDIGLFHADELEKNVVDSGFVILERARHGSTRTDPRIFIVGRKSA
jgi:ubiquinone/menaquinone biosynthesis C-methylase UbiE